MRRLGYVVAMMACLVTVACGGAEVPDRGLLDDEQPRVGSAGCRRVGSAALRRDSLAGADLGPDWSITANELKTAPSSASDCSPGTVLPPFTVVQTEEVAYKFSYGAEAGHVTLIVSVSPTAADIAERIRKVERLPDFAVCRRSASSRISTTRPAVTGPSKVRPRHRWHYQRWRVSRTRIARSFSITSPVQQRWVSSIKFYLQPGRRARGRRLHDVLQAFRRRLRGSYPQLGRYEVEARLRLTSRDGALGHPTGCRNAAPMAEHARAHVLDGIHDAVDREQRPHGTHITKYRRL